MTVQKIYLKFRINKMYKKDFPVFKNNPGLVFFDNAASTQKPQYVID
jgi:selenocysteine lyase/cysteine desulfurase